MNATAANWRNAPNIVEFFEKAQLFGFTGTPIFADNATANKVAGKGTQTRTTKDLFGERLHSYVIVMH